MTPSTEPIAVLDNYDLCNGNVRLRCGDVLLISGHPHVIIAVNASGAKAQPLTGKRVHIQDKLNGTEATFTKQATAHRITNQVEKASVLYRLTKDELQDFLDGKRGTCQPGATNNAAENGDESDMAKKDKKKARGGLAAAAMERKATDGTPKAKRKKAESNGESKPAGKRETLHGFSLCAVIRRLGKEGLTAAQVGVVMDKSGVKPSKATVSIQTGNKKGEAAALTAEQLKELMALAPEPEPAPAKAE